MPASCPVCDSALVDKGLDLRDRDAKEYSCPKCGDFILSGTADAMVRSHANTAKKKAILSYAIRKMQKRNVWPMLDSDLLVRLLETEKLPTPQEQSDNLILWLGDHLEGAGHTVTVTPLKLQSIIGALTPQGVDFVIDHLDRNLLQVKAARTDQGIAHAKITLSFSGWARYENLKRGSISSSKAFMAMKFDDPLLDRIFRERFKPAVKDTGFDLLRLDESLKAGLIDDRLRVDILTARFLVADLTYGNQGAYWEAGFAEGLGKPVIYTCEEKFFKRLPPYEKDGGTHFDTNHHLTVIWNEENLNEATEMLKATIRATLPADAKMEDG